MRRGGAHLSSRRELLAFNISQSAIRPLISPSSQIAFPARLNHESEPAPTLLATNVVTTEGGATGTAHFIDVVAVLDVKHPAMMIAEATPKLFPERSIVSTTSSPFSCLIKSG